MMRPRSRTIVAALMLLVTHATSAQVPQPLTDKVLDLRGEWKRDATRGTGGICGVRPDDTLVFDITGEPPTLFLSSFRFTGRIPLDGSPAPLSDDRTVVATTDAGWLKVTVTRPRGSGFANVMQDVYILNGDRTELTQWRTLNTVRPDGSSGKIDCGNRVAAIYVRQKP